MSYEQLQLFVGMCPSTRQVNLYVDEDLGHLLSPLHSLANLQELKLLACNFYSDRVDRLVREQGHRLTLLHLEHVDELDMSALSLIALCCPALEKLVFFSCDFVENFGSSPEGFSELPFRHLTHLVCVSESAPNVIEFLLVSNNLENEQHNSILINNLDYYWQVATWKKNKIILFLKMDFWRWHENKDLGTPNNINLFSRFPGFFCIVCRCVFYPQLH